MKNLVFATNNKHKLKEVSDILNHFNYQITSLTDIGCSDDIPETADTLEGNALIKARYVYEKYHLDCFSDDTGLEVEALNNAPGVYSARFAGLQCDAEDNMQLLLQKLENKENRKARFRTVIALILDGKEYLFEGIINGAIAKEKEGTEGFGYDPIFVPKGYDLSFASLGEEEKNQISHCAKAVEKLAGFLKKLQG